MNQGHVEANLLAYLDGELAAQDVARVEAHLARCEQCANTLADLRALREDVAYTFDAALAPLRLPAEADRRIRERLLEHPKQVPWWRAIWQQRLVIAQVAVAFIVVLFSGITYQAFNIPQPPSPQETLVLGQERVAPGSQAALRVVVRSVETALPLAGAQVGVSLVKGPGLARTLYQGITDATGTANVAFTVPSDLEGAADLVVETNAAGSTQRIVHPITVARAHKLYLSSDKPAYRPGQTVYARALALDAVTLKAVEGQAVTLALLAPDGRVVTERVASTSDFGIAAFEALLPKDAQEGGYTVQATLGDTVSERTVQVEAYTLPAFRAEVVFGEPFYAPGDWVTGTVETTYVFGKPVVEGRVSLLVYHDAALVTSLEGLTDAQGHMPFAFDVPSDLATTTPDAPVILTLLAEIVDRAGQTVTLQRDVSAFAHPIQVTVVPESGLLKPGVENELYLLTAYPDGQPAATTITLLVHTSDGVTQHPIATDAYGFATFQFTPTETFEQLEVHAQDERGAQSQASFTFATDRAPHVVLLRAERAVYTVGETLRLEVLASASITQPIYLDVVHAEQTVATLAAPLENGHATFALDLEGRLMGTLALRAYVLQPNGSIIEDTRLVVVDPPQHVAVEVTTDQAQYQPGETAQVQVQAALQNGHTAPSTATFALGISVVDASVYALETLPPGFARAYVLLDQAMLKRRDKVTRLELPALLAGEKELRAAQDMAARAAWAGAKSQEATFVAHEVSETPSLTSPAQRGVLWTGSALLFIIAMALLAVANWGLRMGAVWHPALRRVGRGALFGMPVLLPLMGCFGWLAWRLIGQTTLWILLTMITGLWGSVTFHGWRRRDTRVQLASTLLAAYLLLGSCLVWGSTRGIPWPRMLLALLLSALLLIVIALVLLGQGLIVEGRRRVGWTLTLLALLLIPLASAASLVPTLQSDLTRILGHPSIYAGPLGWLTGCAGATPEFPAEMVEKEVAATSAPVADEMVESEKAAEPAAPSPTPMPTMSPAPTAIPPPSAEMPVPAEPWPLRQVFPETLYWNPEALTDQAGHAAYELPLADTVTTWRMTILASTRTGKLGVATRDIPVALDFFITPTLPDTVQAGDVLTVTVMLYNNTSEAQSVRVAPVAAEWYSLMTAPDTVLVEAGDITTATLVLHPEKRGTFALQIMAEEGTAHILDAVATQITVH